VGVDSVLELNLPLICRGGSGLWLEMRLTLADYLVCLDCCESFSGCVVKGTGIDLAPEGELIGVCVNLDENDFALLENFLDELFSALYPSLIGRSQLRLVLNNLSESQVSRFVLVPEQAVFQSGH
jgi:hypothetical protein